MPSGNCAATHNEAAAPPDSMKDDLGECIKRMERSLTKVERATTMPTWKKVLYAAGLAFLTASTARYWIGPEPTYVALPCVEQTLEAYHGR
jgi:hypothetical protein